MKISLTVLAALVCGQLFGQNIFAKETREEDSLNRVYYNKLKSSGQIDKKGLKTGEWNEYELLIDSTESSSPVTVQGADFSLALKFKIPSTLVRSLGTYSKGQRINKWRWFRANYYGDSLSWKISRETEYKKGKKNGTEKELDSFGNIHREAKYFDDELNEYERIYWYKDRLFAEIQWTKGNVRIATFYSQDGIIQLKEDHTKPLTEVTKYDEKGNLVETKYFKDGVEVNK